LLFYFFSIQYIYMIKAEVKTDPDSSSNKNQIIKEMLEARVCYGHRSSITNPKMKSYISGTKNNFEVIDLEKTFEALEKSKKFMEELGQQKKTLLFVGTSPIIRDLVTVAAEKTRSPYSASHWIGGFLTNFKTIFGRLKYFRELKAKEASGELQKYTKKEQINFQKEIQKLSQLFMGLEECQGLPNALVVVNVKTHETAVREAKKLKIPIIGIVDTDSEPQLADYVIPASDHIRSSVNYLLNQLVSGYNTGESSKT